MSLSGSSAGSPWNPKNGDENFTAQYFVLYFIIMAIIWVLAEVYGIR